MRLLRMLFILMTISNIAPSEIDNTEFSDSRKEYIDARNEMVEFVTRANSEHDLSLKQYFSLLEFYRNFSDKELRKVYLYYKLNRFYIQDGFVAQLPRGDSLYDEGIQTYINREEFMNIINITGNKELFEEAFGFPYTEAKFFNERSS